MAQWRRIQSLAQAKPEVASRLSIIYRDDRKYLLDIRQSCSDWMESIDWLNLDTNLSGTIMQAQRLYQDLLNQIDFVASKPESDIVKKINLSSAKQNLQERYSSNLLAFIEVIKKCLGEEKLLIQSCEPNNENVTRPLPNKDDQAKENPQLMDKLSQVSMSLQIAENELTTCTDLQQKFRVEYTSDMESINQLKIIYETSQPGAEQEMKRTEFIKKQTDLQTKIANSFQRRQRVAENFVRISKNTKQVVDLVWLELSKWQKDKKLEITGLSKPKEGIVDILDKTCNQMNQILLQLLAQLDKLTQLIKSLNYSTNEKDDTPTNVAEASLNTELLIKLHLQKVFVVDRNPPCVLKVITGKSLGFAMSCRILGGHALGLQMNPPRVTAELHKENDVVGALHNHGKTGMCKVINGENKIMEFHRDNNQWLALFNSVQLQNVRQPEKINDRLVMENLNGMVFYTTLKIRSKEYELAALSLPMVIISHVLQDCQARAFLIWDAAFSDDDSKRKMFDHPEQVPWSKIAVVLDALFKKNTGRGLRDDHLDYLGRIAFKEKHQPDRAALQNRQITKNQLIKDKLQKDFQFWKWFYANMNLIKERLQKEWQDELIYGFIAKDETMKKLSNKPPGTFMLRFSESDIENSNKADICGCLTLAVYERNPHSDNFKVYHVKEHLTPKDIHERGLATTLDAFEVKDFETSIKRPLLKFLYPDREFLQTFNKYILQKRNESRDDNDGYKAGQLRIEIFLADGPVDTRGRRPLSTTHASPMSPTPSVASDMTNPLSPQIFPMSPPPDLNDDTSQNRPLAVTTDGGKKIAVGLVYPVQNNPVQNNNGHSVEVSSTFAQRQISVTASVPLEHSMNQMDLSPTFMSIGTNVPGFPLPPTPSELRPQPIYANTDGELLPGLDGQDFGRVDSAGIPLDVDLDPSFFLDSGNSLFGSGSQMGSGQRVPVRQLVPGQGVSTSQLITDANGDIEMHPGSY